jgi:hypothetical protein
VLTIGGMSASLSASGARVGEAAAALAAIAAWLVGRVASIARLQATGTFGVLKALRTCGALGTSDEVS